MEMIKLILLVAVAYAFIEPGWAADVSCKTVDRAISTCGKYLIGMAFDPTAECCSGMRSIHEAASSTQARRETCNCIQQTVSMYSDLYDHAARMLTGKCGVKAGIPISRGFDCSR
ncbi:Non-specific lipid-transfer protein 2A [Acorus calamus]|uniref:Non-specific lipid-transfer protein n=1 Tax=Acorus calamus TaxID=4465 RepID=A0AAV9C3B6_ACOCL|nr:Non-specific lipid-transfer protein 2A [Acorus calamus]